MKEPGFKVNRILDLAILLAVSFGLVLISFLVYLVTPGQGKGLERVVIPPGATLRNVAHLLQGKGLISSPIFFQLWARILGYEKRIQPGEYDIVRGICPLSLLKDLASLKGKAEWVTIPEGWQASQIASLLEERGICPQSEFMSHLKDPETLREWGIEGDSFEGYLFPDTYRLHRDTGPKAIIRIMVENFFRKNQGLIQRAKEKGLGLKEMVTLASMVEKEAKTAEERRIIAGVFFNRLKKGMKLQSDPTAVYDPDSTPKKAINSFDIRRPTKYNTYVIEGLPPGPICNPGKDSLLAVLEPIKTKYLYFVSQKDGTHHFSETHEQHTMAIGELKRKMLPKNPQ